VANSLVRARAGDDSVASIASAIPLRAQLWHKQLKPDELLVLLAMLEIGDSTGQFLFPCVPRVADYTKLSERTVQKILHGEDRRPNNPGTRRPRAVYVGLIERRVLVEIAPANATKRRAATYRLQVEALQDSRRTERWRQKKLPFPADDMDLEKWVHHNPGAWSQIRHELRMAAEARVGGQPLSPAASAAFMVSIARKHGMPHRLALLCVETSRK
jgi:helix-turn-helix protein